MSFRTVNLATIKGQVRAGAGGNIQFTLNITSPPNELVFYMHPSSIATIETFRNEDGFVSHRLTFMAVIKGPTQNSASQVVIDFDHDDEASTVAMMINMREINVL
jgi:hypothetical protein